MTIREKLTELLVENGMRPNDASEVMERVIDDDGAEVMEGRWDEVIDGYPKSLMATLWLITKSIALEWIDANNPEAFYRPLFVNA